MMNDYTAIQRAFNKAATSYDEHALIQQLIGKELIALMQSASPKSVCNIIDLGCGTGLTTEHLIQQFDFCKLYAIDISENLLNKAKERLYHDTRVVFNLANFDNLSGLHSPIDIIFSNMALHWSQHFELLLQNIASLLSKNSILAFSLPLFGTFKELPNHTRNDFFTFEEVKHQLAQVNLLPFSTHQKNYTLNFKDSLSSLRWLKKTGVTHVQDRKKTTLNRKLMLEKMDVNQLTFCVGYFIVKRHPIS